MELSLPRARWGVPLFGKSYQGLPPNALNILETADVFSGLLGIALFINTGLKHGEHVTLVTFDAPENVLARFQRLGFDFEAAVDSGVLCIISYKHTLLRSLNIATDYQAMIEEIRRLGTDKTARFAILNANLLFNLESHTLTTLSVSKLSMATRGIDGTVLAQFTTVDDESHQRLRHICTSLLPC